MRNLNQLIKHLLAISTLFLTLVSSNQELPLISESEVNILKANSTEKGGIPKTHFLLLCYQRDKACIAVENELLFAFDQLHNDFGTKLAEEFTFRRMECIDDYQRELCKSLGHKHSLKPPRVKIIGSSDRFGGWIYNYTSPMEATYFKKKIMRFTITQNVIPGEISKIRNFDDFKVDGDVCFALESEDPQLNKMFEDLAIINKEKMYFFKANKTSSSNESILYTIGKQYETKYILQHDPRNPQKTRNDLEKQIQKGVGQDLVFWDINAHIKNQTYIDSIKDKLIVVASVSRESEHLSNDFLLEFRKFVQARRFHLDRYEFVVIDTDNKPVFRYMTEYFIGVFDSPGIFAIKDAQKQVYYRNYETYSGSNFKNISEDFLTKINTGQKRELYTRWIDSLKNIPNLEYWSNNLLKSYIYFVGLFSGILIPIFLIVDCFKPLLGRGPNAKKKIEAGEVAQEGEQQADGKIAAKKKREAPTKKKIE